jgi:hypothetical protein
LNTTFDFSLDDLVLIAKLGCNNGQAYSQPMELIPQQRPADNHDINFERMADECNSEIIIMKMKRGK